MKLTPKNLAKAYAKHGSIKKAHKHEFSDVSWGTVQKIYVQAVKEKIMPKIRPGVKTREQLRNPAQTIKAPTGTVKAMQTKVAALPRRGAVKRYLFSYAQNNTDIFLPFWKNLLALKEFYDARLH